MTTSAEPDRLIRTGEAAKILQVSRATVRSWSERGALDFRLTPSGQRRFRLSDVQKLAEDGTAA